MRCIAKGCTSGYDSNPEKVHFFRVPKNPNVAKLWEIACKHMDISLNKYHVFCEKHFKPNDIVTKKEFRDGNGVLVAESTLLRARLKKGAVPSEFSCIDFPVEENVNRLTFDQVTCNDKLYVPSSSWTRNILLWGNKRALLFTKTTAHLVENKIEPICLKQLLLHNDMTVELKVMHKCIDSNILGINNTITSLDQLQNAFNVFDKFNVCKGYTVKSGECEKISLSFAYEESKNKWRHNNCPLLLSRLWQCNHCKYLGKEKRCYLDTAENIQRIRLVKLSSTKGKNMNLLKEMKNTSTRKAKQKRNLLNNIKKEFDNM